MLLAYPQFFPPRATGQAHRPAPPVTTGKSSSLNKTQGDADKVTNCYCYCYCNLNKARKHGMEEYIAADPITFEHHALFKKLQSLSLDWRLNDPFASLVSPILHICSLYYIFSSSKA